MQTTVLGRTGLTVTRAGLGSGGRSRLGLNKFGQDHAASIVRAAYDSGVTFFDTATVYGTESAVGQGLAGIPRDRYVLSTKFPYKVDGGSIKSAQDLLATLEESLRALRVDCVDILHLHGVHPDDYVQARDALVPAMIKAKEQGKIRFPGITELFGSDTTHDMFKLALPDDFFDVVMIGYNLLNPSAVKALLPQCMERGVGTLCMFAVRDSLSNPDNLRLDISRMLESGQVDPSLVSADEDLSFLKDPDVAGSIMEAAYRFCRHTQGIDVTLTGTGNADHLRDNLASIEKPRLPDATLAKLYAMFGNVDCVSGQG